MLKVHIHDGELRIPLTDDVREKLAVHEGEELDAHVFNGSMTLTRTSAEARQQAGARILALIDQVRVRQGQPVLSEEDADRLVDEEVREHRRSRRR